MASRFGAPQNARRRVLGRYTSVLVGIAVVIGSIIRYPANDTSAETPLVIVNVLVLTVAGYFLIRTVRTPNTPEDDSGVGR